MPELPEVETIARVLREGAGSGSAGLLGSRIESCQVLWERTIASPPPAEFCRRIQGQTINAVSRRGKFLVMQLTQDHLLFHLRMSGDLRVDNALDEHGQPLPARKHDRLVLELEGGRRLAFNDTRKFGRVWLTADPQEVLGGLGPEPLDPALTAEGFRAMLAERGRQLKPLLMDQGFLAGLGNIYTDEALFRAGLHPLTRSDTLRPAQIRRLHQAIRSVLRLAIRNHGTTLDWIYPGGWMQRRLMVYGRTGEPCRRCRTAIVALRVGQRGTHICPKCQRRGEE